jgi:uncharacterized protein DUF4440
MRNGTVVAAICFVALGGFLAYQSWFNPTRAVQRRLSEIAAALSMPDHEAPAARATRAARLRRYLADDLRVHTASGEITSRDQIVGAVAAFAPPPGGWDVQFVDVQVRVNHDSNADADAYLTVEVNGRDERTGQPTVDRRDAAVTMKKIDGEWVVTSADTKGQ